MKRQFLKFSEFLTEMPRNIKVDKETGKIQPGSERERFRTWGDKTSTVAKLPSGHTIIKSTPTGYTSTAAQYTATHDNKIHMQVTGAHDEDGSYMVGFLKGHKETTIKAHEFYHHLLHHFDIRSDVEHSKGAKKTWKALSEKPDVKITHHDYYGKKIKLYTGKDWSKNYGRTKNTYFRATLKKNDNT